MRDSFVKTLIDIAKQNPNVELLTGDLGFGVLKPFYEQCPNQFTNVGIAEQNMAGIAAGMASLGKTVFVYSIANFPTLRCLEQIRNDCAYHRLNVKIVSVGGGFTYGALGMTHQATEDIAVMRALPDVAVLCPGDLVEAAAATRAATAWPGTVYLRLGRGGEMRVHHVIDDFKIGKAIKIADTTDLHDKKTAILSTGAILGEVCEATTILSSKFGIGTEQFSFPTVKPIDKECILKCCQKYDWVFTVEEHNVVGGFGSAVAEVTSESGLPTRLIRIGINDQYCHIVGSQKYLRNQFGLSAKSISQRIADTLM